MPASGSFLEGAADDEPKASMLRSAPGGRGNYIAPLPNNVTAVPPSGPQRPSLSATFRTAMTLLLGVLGLSLIAAVPAGAVPTATPLTKVVMITQAMPL